VILAAVHFNNRRLAWVSLVLSLTALYFLLPPNAAKRRLKRLGFWLMPVVAGYVIVGWGRPERIFKPLASLSSVSSKPDGSTLARNVENLSLIATASYSPLTGSGWGRPYVELSNKYTIAGAMELWPYIPHNSILGLFAYTGILGVMGYWLMIPTGVFLHARCARHGKDPRLRTVGTAGVMVTLTCLGQMFGDMGIFSPDAMYLLAAVWGGAMRLPIEGGVWGAGSGFANRTAVPPTPAAPPQSG
jgi:O-antigen ligase